MSGLRRIRLALAALAGVTAFGIVGYLLLGFTLLEAVYQTITTVATVGFREVRPLDATGQVFTIVLILLGVGTALYTFGVLMEAVIEGHLTHHLERRRMDARIAALRGHVVICGHGRVGASAVEFLHGAGHRLVVVDADPERLTGLPPDVPFLVGNVNDDEVLRQAGVEHARAVIIALDTDADTVYATLSARAMCPDTVIVARARTTDSKHKLELAGASRAVNPQRIGGRRLAAFALQPDVAEFLDVVMHDDNLDWRVQQIGIADGSALAGRSVAEMRIAERTGALLLAVRPSPGAALLPNPGGDLTVPADGLLIALGTQAELEQLTALAAPGR
ncbi:potassium channel protein [Nocardioides sp.]|uniref:potassium channel family protein n=1 Tax=Nocardioides sp. TaxID=35761 RepID=UPI001A1F4831|nr:potassium channel protein [Nocardioides sp.]MBJ7357182.1 potassium channel protein [Nocardioides sp.]